MQLLDAVADAGLFGDMTTLWEANGVKLTRFSTDEICLYELKLTPEGRARPSVKRRMEESTDHLYQLFEEDGCLIGQYVYGADHMIVEEELRKYVTAA